MERISLQHGREVFGSDPVAYAAGRPDYPSELYEVLSNRCGLRASIAVFEVGPGSGVATKEVLQAGVAMLRAIEPDPNFAALLRATFPGDTLKVDQCAFEHITLPAESFDLGIAATSFHWLEQSSALTKVRGALRRSGWWAMWWTHFGAGDKPDPFQLATGHLFVNAPQSPGISKNGVPFALDRDARLRDLRHAGFVLPDVETWRWRIRYDTRQLVRLYSTFSSVQSLDLAHRERLLGQLVQIAEKQFGGKVDREFVTVLYTARRP